MSFPGKMAHPKVFFAPAYVPPDLGMGFQDKRNRNPNWTDHEIMRFLDILQEDKVMKDLMAQRNKQVKLSSFLIDCNRLRLDIQL